MVIYIGDQIFKCGICAKKIKANETIFQEETHLRVFCSTCKSIFPKKDLELVIDLLISHNGFFGQLKHSAPEQSIKDLLIKCREEQKLTMQEINNLMMHRALLYGITPKQFIKKLELLKK